MILSNPAPRQVASDKWQIVAWSPVLNLKPKVEKFEERMTVKIIIKRIIKALLKSKLIYSFDLTYSHGLVSGITSLSMFLLTRPASLWFLV